MTRGLFITATGTDVGKTFVASGLARVLVRQGLDVGVWKPVQSGWAAADHPAADSAILCRAAKVAESANQVCSFSFAPPLTPLLAARASGVALNMAQILASGEALLQAHDLILVEGAGGLAVPLTQNKMIVDLALNLDFPVLLVAAPGLGTINQTLLSVSYARQRGLRVAGIIFNGGDPAVMPLSDLADFDPCPAAHENSQYTNPLLVAQFGDIPVLGWVPRLQTNANDLEQRADWVETHLSIPAILASASA